MKGGIFAAPTGQFGDRRFNRPMGVGCDASGNVYVASSGSTSGGSAVLECYGATGALKWRRVGLTFVDLPDANTTGMDVFFKDKHFVKGSGAGDAWRYQGYTVNPYKYPDDVRLHAGMTNGTLHELGGKPFLFVSDMTADYLAVYRFSRQTEGETAIPCVLFAKRHHNEHAGYPAGQPEKGEWVWEDRNGNGKIEPQEIRTNDGANSQGIITPDIRGTLWQANGPTHPRSAVAGHEYARRARVGLYKGENVCTAGRV